MRRAAVAVAAVLAARAGDARADFADWRALKGGAWLHYELSGLHDADDTRPAAPAARATDERPAVRDFALVGVRLHGFVSHSDTVGYHVGFDLAAGGAIRGGGFAYDVTLYPIGAALRLGKTSFAALGAGVGAMGATGVLDDAATFPVEFTAELGGGRVRLLARGRAAWIAGAAARHGGAPSIGFVDELDATLGVRVGHGWDDYGYPNGNGYFVGAAYRELMGARFVGVTLGYSLEIATPRGH